MTAKIGSGVAKASPRADKICKADLNYQTQDLFHFYGT